MTGHERAEALAAALPGASLTTSFGEATVDVPADAWRDALRLARDDHRLGYLDWLSAYEDTDAVLVVVCHLVALEPVEHLLVRTRVDAVPPSLPSAVAVFRGADWHEREAAEMFGLTFTGHPAPGPLLLPAGFEGHPLRKGFVLAARAARPWPGAKEPGESGPAVRRRRTLPPGVPAAGRWRPADQDGEQP
ncbi:MAG TPA: NADH-quinone oxidoreductase subunit C [Actinomycetes bacterium]